MIVTSGASPTGWGYDREGVQYGGHWSHAEMFHINYLEIKAAFSALKCPLSKLQNKHVRLMLDTVTAVFCLNRTGTNHSVPCNAITQAVRTWYLSHNIWISAAHIPGKDHVVADQLNPKRVNMDAEWMIGRNALQSALAELEIVPGIDLFASRLNAQLPRFVSYRPDRCSCSGCFFRILEK